LALNIKLLLMIVIMHCAAIKKGCKKESRGFLFYTP